MERPGFQSQHYSMVLGKLLSICNSQFPQPVLTVVKSTGTSVRIQIPALSLTSYVILGKLLNSLTQFPQMEVERDKNSTYTIGLLMFIQP